MAKLPIPSLVLVLLFAMLSVQHSIAADPPEISPAPVPETGYDAVSPTPTTAPAPSPENLSPSPAFADFSPTAPAPTPESLSPSPAFADSSPPAPPEDVGSPSPSPSPSSANANAPSDEYTPAPAPAPAPAPGAQIASDITHESAESANESHDGGMSGGKKVSIAFGAISGMFVVGLAAKVYKKRQENMRRAQFGHSARGGML